jgi:hypothetical protein
LSKKGCGKKELSLCVLDGCVIWGGKGWEFWYIGAHLCARITMLTRAAK